MLLRGISNAGKTRYALAHFSNPLQVRAKDDGETEDRCPSVSLMIAARQLA
jgi:hypothetical protein